MRIVAGAWRGRPLAAPAGAATRPTADRARETLFSMLASRLGTFHGLAVLDLFAGTGALGLEALSRGADRATFVENDRSALVALRANIRTLGAAARAEVMPRDAAAPGAAQCHFDLAFLDPPYGRGLADRALAALVAGGWLAPGAWIAVESGRDESLDASAFTVDATRDVGKARLALLRLT
jgi:16S rRNA (guanine966-N2)-methyltransferase